MSFNLANNVALQNILAAMEIDRQRIASVQKKGYYFIGAGIAIAIVVLIMGFILPALGIGLIPIIYGGIQLYKISDELKAYENAYKVNVIGEALRFLDPTLIIRPHEGINSDEFVYSQLFTREPDRYRTEDLVTGKADKTAFYFAEVHAEYKTETQTKNGTRTQWHNIFEGIIFVADFNKNLNGITIVRPKDFGNAIGAWFSKNLFSFNDRDIIKLENLDFDRTFLTYGNNQVESRYILTPAMMERILQLNSKTKSCISVSFIQSRMYIAFPLDRNYFEAPLFESLLRPALLDDDISAIKFMYDIGKELDLNTRIWGKT